MCEKKGERGGTDLKLAAQFWNRKKPSFSPGFSPEQDSTGCVAAYSLLEPSCRSSARGWGSPGRASWRRGASQVMEMVGSLQLTHCGCTSAGFPFKKRSR